MGSHHSYLKNEKTVFSPCDSIYLPVAFVMFVAAAASAHVFLAAVRLPGVSFACKLGDFVAFVVLPMLVILLPPVLDVEFCANAF